MTQNSQQTCSPKISLLRKLMSGLRFFPKTHDFFGFYDQSINNIVIASELLCTMIEHPNDRTRLAVQLKEYEHAGDRVKHEVVELLRQTFLTPFDRLDMYNLAIKLDKILDSINFIGNRLTRYHVTQLPPQVLQLAKIVLHSTQILSKMIPLLRNLKHCELIVAQCQSISLLEHEADEQLNLVLEDLFNNQWDAIQIIKVKELVEGLEATSDRCKGVANIIEGIILKHV